MVDRQKPSPSTPSSENPLTNSTANKKLEQSIEQLRKKADEEQKKAEAIKNSTQPLQIKKFEVPKLDKIAEEG